MIIQYQPGPWQVAQNGKVVDASGNCVLIQGFSSGLPGVETEANMRLCVAAPQLLDALQNISHVLNSLAGHHRQAMTAIAHAQHIISAIQPVPSREEI